MQPGDGEDHQRGDRPGVIVAAQRHRAQDEHRDDQPGPPQHHRPGGPEDLPPLPVPWSPCSGHPRLATLPPRSIATSGSAARSCQPTVGQRGPALDHRAEPPALPCCSRAPRWGRGPSGGGSRPFPGGCDRGAAQEGCRITTVIWSIPGAGPVTARRRPAGPPLARPARPPWRVSTACYAVFAGYAALVAVFSGPGQDRGWAVWAAAGYTAALLLSRRRGAGRAAALAASAAGAVAGPVIWLAWRAPPTPDVRVVARSAVLLLQHGTPYLAGRSPGQPDRLRPVPARHDRCSGCPGRSTWTEWPATRGSGCARSPACCWCWPSGWPAAPTRCTGACSRWRRPCWRSRSRSGSPTRRCSR